jgi:L-ascorbate metabolism protein UlaG (beta-lactamase superfamily)
MRKTSKKREERILSSPNFKRGAFQNLSKTPMLAADTNYFAVFRDFFLNENPNRKPTRQLPSIKTDLKSLRSLKPVIIWFGHSSYLIHSGGKNILVDPVFSGSASPFSFMIKAFPGTDVYTANELPEIDMVIITHNHYDHLDRELLKQVKSKAKSFCTALGVGRHLENYKLDPSRIKEMDWWEKMVFPDGIEITATPARHFSGRGFKRNGTLWTSFVLKLDGYTVFIGGDSGYDTHFKKIGDIYGPFDIVILECGQYNDAWPYIHMNPEETVQAGIDLKARLLLPVHWGKFALANHPWNEPIVRVVKKAAERNLNITTPLIGQPVILDLSYPSESWWIP